MESISNAGRRISGISSALEFDSSQFSKEIRRRNPAIFVVVDLFLSPECVIVDRRASQRIRVRDERETFHLHGEEEGERTKKNRSADT